MVESPVNSSPRSSTDDSVDIDLHGVDHNGIASTSSGITDSSSRDDMYTESASNRRSNSDNGQPRKYGKNGENPRLGVLATKLFDDRIPLKKKLKLFHHFANVKDDGTVQLEVPEHIKPHGPFPRIESNHEEPFDTSQLPDIPPLQIVMLIVGTRGDVQPFIAIGKRLQGDGHRVRLATHANFKDFVLSAGLEFFPLGGDPKVLAGYMVKNKGFLPSTPSEILIQRQQIREIVFSLYPACKDPDPDTNIPFNADAIIANPPSYGHTHVAEELGIPIHVFFTMPWTPTSEFPHPLSRVRQSVAYKLSYQIVDAMMWLGMRDIINEFRKKKLKLRPTTYLSGNSSSPPDVPYGYIWSPHLVPKPKDWGPKIDVVGFCFLDLASNYEPPEELENWLGSGDPPIYIGFGSLVSFFYQSYDILSI